MNVRKLLLLCFAVISSLGYSQFKFNEYCCANVGNVIDPLGVGYQTSPDWVELMNTTTTTQSLFGWAVGTDRTGSNSFVITTYSSTPIKIDSFGLQVIFLCTHGKQAPGTIGTQTVDLHANFQLNQTQNPVLYLFKPVGQALVLADSVAIKRNKPDHSWGKPNSDSAAYYTDTTTGGKGFGLNAWRLYPVASPGKKNPNNKGVPWGGTPPNPPFYYLDYAPTPKLVTPPGHYSSGAPLTITVKDTTAPVYIIESGIKINIKDSLETFATTDCTNPLTFSQGQIIPTTLNVYDLGPLSPTGTKGQIPIPYYNSGAPTPNPTLVGVVLRVVMHDISVLHPNYLDGFEAYGAYVLDSTYHMGYSCFCIDTAKLFTPSPTQILDTAGTTGDNASIFCYVSNTTTKQVFQNQGQALVNRIDFLNNFNPKAQWQFQFRAEDEYGYNYSNKYAFFTNQSLGSTSRADFPELVFRSSAEDNFLKGGTGGISMHGANHLRDFFNHTITLRHKLNFESSHYVPTYLFINGINRGIYYIKEPIDTTYTKYYYNYTHADIIASDIVPTLPVATHSLTVLSGKLTDWNNFYNWAMGPGFNVHVPALYQIFADDFDIQSFCDYNFYNMFSVNSNFVNKQALWWKGRDSIANTSSKWRFGLTNTDETWGLQPYSLTQNTPCDYMSVGPGANNQYPLIPLLIKLLTNDTFKSSFYSRYQDLLNTSYSCDSLTAHLSYVQSLLKADIPSHSYWNVGGDSVKYWIAMVDTMNAFIMQQCSTALPNMAASACLSADGPYNVCINVQPVNSGTVKLNTIPPFTSYPVNNLQYTDSFYCHANAIPDSNYVFDHWETPYTVNLSTINDSIAFYVTQSACLTAVFKLKPPYETTGTPMLPEAFSPNGDGINDTLNVYGIANATSYSFYIYNRWGEQLFYSNKKEQGWSGTYPSGVPAQVGVYAYRYDIVMNGKTYVKNGSVTLLR